MHSGGAARSKSSTRTRSGTSRYGLRSKSESLATSTAIEDIYVTPLKPEVSSKVTTPSTPSHEVCTICKGVEDLRNLNLKDAISNFTDKIEIFKDLTKSSDNNNSTLSHALDTIKHFIIRIEPDKLNDCFAKIDSGINSLHSEIANLPNITYLESRLESFEVKLPNMDKLNARIDALQHKLSELSRINSKPVVSDNNLPNISNYIVKLDSIQESVNDKIRNISSFSNSTDLTEHICKLESLCSQLSRKLELANSHHNAISPSTSYQSNPILETRVPSPKTCLIIGDSNTKHIKLDDDQMTSHRVPTYLIEDIDPNLCFGYKKIWIHVGTNNIKTVHCSNTSDVYRHFDTLMHKLNNIRSLCPHSKIVVSPIPPIAILVLNKRAIAFNKLLLSQKRFFSTMDFNMFCGPDGKLTDIYRCYNNVGDEIHFGSLGIKILTSKIKHCMSHLDHRSYASAAKQF